MYRQLTEKEVKNFERHVKVLQAYMECNPNTTELVPLIQKILEYVKEVNAIEYNTYNTLTQSHIELANEFQKFVNRTISDWSE